MRVPETLRNLMHQRQCVAFVGAGFSMACGMPGWNQLLTHLRGEAEQAMSDYAEKRTIASIDRALKNNRLLLAVSLVRQLLTGVDLDRAVGKQFSMSVFHGATTEQQQRMENRLRNLVNGPWAGIITTNYDALIEYGLGKFTRGDYIQSSATDADFGTILCSHSANMRFFVKLHGSVRGTGYVLGTEEYDETYLTNPRVTAFLTASMMRYHMVFIGCSLEDEILRLRRRLCHDFDANIPPAYALLPKDDDNVARKQLLLSQAQIVSLLYGVKGQYAVPDGHGELDRFLESSLALPEP